MALRLLTWNLQWATPGSWRTPEISARVRREDADVAVLTEAQLAVARDLYPHVVDAGPHPRAGQPNGSKVVVASTHPLDVVDLTGSPDLPPHNFVAVDVRPPDDDVVRVIGLVIRWSEKRTFVDALPSALDGLVTDRTVIAGDYNLSLLRGTRLEQDLLEVLAAHAVRVVTGGPWPVLADETPLIDHIAVAPGLREREVKVWGRHVETDPRRITDHAGASVTLDVDGQHD